MTGKITVRLIDPHTRIPKRLIESFIRDTQLKVEPSAYSTRKVG